MSTTEATITNTVVLNIPLIFSAIFPHSLFCFVSFTWDG